MCLSGHESLDLQNYFGILFLHQFACMTFRRVLLRLALAHPLLQLPQYFDKAELEREIELFGRLNEADVAAAVQLRLVRSSGTNELSLERHDWEAEIGEDRERCRCLLEARYVHPNPDIVVTILIHTGLYSAQVLDGRPVKCCGFEARPRNRSKLVF